MKIANFDKMSFEKKVKFIEKIDKSILGLEGLQIITYADKTRTEKNLDIDNPNYEFLKLSKKMLKKINGKYIQKKYKLFIKTKKDEERFKKLLLEERVKWISKKMKS